MMRFYRALLRLYPSSFRREYGDEMAAIFQRRFHDAGSAGRILILFAAIPEVFLAAAAVHWDIFAQDLRYASRTLRHAPAFTLTAILLVAIGVGANTAAFSVTDFVLLRPLPYREPDRLVKLWQATPGGRFELSPENYRDWRRAARSFASMGAFWSIEANFVAGSEPYRLTGASVSWDLLPTLGVGPLIGRSFNESDDRTGAFGTVILSQGLWQTLFAGNPAVLGERILLDGQPHEIIGVMPAGFAYPSSQTEFWTALRLSPEDTDRTNTYLQVVGRLEPGTTIQQVRAEMTAIADRLAALYPKENREVTASVIPLRDEVSRRSRLLLLALSGAALCVLLIVCANLANLLMARALTRRREMAVRTALGAGRERVARQLLTESCLLASAGGILGMLAGYATLPLLAPPAPANLPASGAPSIDLRVLLFATALTALTAIGFGLVPTLRVRKGMDDAGLREGARGGAVRQRLRGLLVVGEIVASIALLATAGLLIRALWTVQNTDPGFRSDNVLTMRTALPWPEYSVTEKRADFYTRVLDAVRQLPGVTDASYISGLPMVRRGSIWTVELPGDAGRSGRDARSVSLRYTTPGFFRTLGVPILVGRDIGDRDTGAAEKVAVVSESFARRFLPGGNPIGRRFSVAFFERTIVGVAADIRVRGLEMPSEPQVYLPYRQIPDGFMSTYAPSDLAIHSTQDAAQLVPAVRAIVRRVDPRQPISHVRQLSEIVHDDTAPRAGQLRVLGAFAAIAALLAVVGIHGLLAFAVSQRTQEFGVRIALGATPVDLGRMVFRQAAWLALVGSLPGLLLAYAAGRGLQSILAGVPPADPVTLLGVVALVVVMALAGSLSPMRRALRFNVADALRVEA